MDIQEIEKSTNRILGAYPNTYTFTKAMAEKLLEKRRGNVPLCLVRPSIIGASLSGNTTNYYNIYSIIAASLVLALLIQVLNLIMMYDTCYIYMYINRTNARMD